MRKINRWAHAFGKGTKIIGHLLHEFFHALMAVLLYPFGTTVTGIKIIAGPTKEGYLFDGVVYISSRRKWCVFLIATAPQIGFALISLYLAINMLPLVGCMTWFLESMLPSEADKQNIRFAFGKGEANSFKGDLGSYLNQVRNITPHTSSDLSSLPTPKKEGE